MELTLKQISSLHKVMKTDKLSFSEIHQKTAIRGERFSYQICFQSDGMYLAKAEIKSELREHIRIYWVKDAVMDAPITVDTPIEDYITHDPSLMPDILVPMEEFQNTLTVTKTPNTFWIKVDIPADIQPGKYPIHFELKCTDLTGKIVGEFFSTMEVDVIPASLPAQNLIHTRWIYLDCIANAHQTEIFSEQHWQWIERYIAAAADVGINMILVPVHTPPLDTLVGTVRPCVQLVDIEKKGNIYSFGFERFHRYIDICKKYGISYFEIAHMFSQWGAKFAPNIMVSEGGKAGYQFGWHVKSDDPEYTAFLKQYIAAIARQLEKEGISEYTYFHISDEPTLENIEQYKAAAEIIRPLIGNSKTFDALSDFAFYEKDLVACPVTSIHNIHTFLEHNIENQWVYYCCLPQSVYPNAFMAMPSYRIRMLGFLIYRYNIKGFLNWGFNFYNAFCSAYQIDPFSTTSANGAYPSGDPFIVYPGKKCVYPSIRGEVTFEAIQDIDICFTLEKYIGRNSVMKMIDDAAGGKLRFDSYPRNNEFIENLRQKMILTIAEHQS